MDNGNKLSAFKEVSDSDKVKLTGFSALKHAPTSSYIALAFTPAGAARESYLILHTSPIKVEMYSPDGDLQVTLNERALLHYEASSGESGAAVQAIATEDAKDRHGGKKVVDYGEDGKLLLIIFFI